MGLLTLFGFSALGWLLMHFTSDTTIDTLLSAGWPWYAQSLTGLAYGLAAALTGWSIIKSKLLAEVRNFYTDLILQLRLEPKDIVFLSLCAGIGEEMLFRGGLQPWMQELTGYHWGVWITSTLFVGIHGYLNPIKLRLSLYGLFMTIAVAGIGYLFIHTGIFTAMAAHFAIDLVLLRCINQESRKEYANSST